MTSFNLQTSCYISILFTKKQFEYRSRFKINTNTKTKQKQISKPIPILIPQRWSFQYQHRNGTESIENFRFQKWNGLWKSIGIAQVWLSIGKSCYKQIGLAQIGPIHLSLPSHIIRPWQPWQEQLKINNIKKSCECPTIELT